jgi:phosphoglycerate dehydrogenase-like enzyme
MPRILIADPFDPSVKEEFVRKWESKGYIVVDKPALKGKDLADELATGNYDALIVGSKEVAAGTLRTWRNVARGKELLVVRAGSDPSHIAFGEAAELGIVVMNTPGLSKDPVAKYVLDLLAEDGRGKTIGLIGYGAIGKEVARVALQRGYKVQVYSPHLTKEQAAADGLIFAADAKAALREADVIIPAAHLVPHEEADKVNKVAGRKIISPSEALIDGEALVGAKPGVHVISPSRPGLFDVAALEDAFKKGRVSKIDFNTTPHDIEHLSKHHSGLSEGNSDIQPSGKFLTPDARKNVAVQALEGIVGFFESKKIVLPVVPPELEQHHTKLRNHQQATAPVRVHPVKAIIEKRRHEIFDESNIQVEAVETPYAKIFFTYENEATPTKYAYSGVRVLSPMSDEDAVSNAKRLSLTSSSWKNWLINHAVKDGALDNLSASSRRALSSKVWNNREVYGGRAIIIPHDRKYKGIAIETILKDSDHPYFAEVSAPIYAAIGKQLNKFGGKLQVTPDFGPNASTADLMYAHSPHVLGISFENGGSGGKSEYSVTSILTALRRMGIENAPKDSPITVIGAAGALGSGVCAYLARQGFTNVIICDLQYTDNPPRKLPKGWKIAKAENGKFTDECLTRGGTLITAAYGDEMMQSHWQKIPPNTLWIGAQNKDLPEKEAGIDFARQLHAQGVRHIPGQILTIGGTTASWTEWCARQEGKPFSRDAAHEVVHRVTDKLVVSMLDRAEASRITPYEAMLDYAHKSHWQERNHAHAVSANQGRPALLSRL